MQPRDMWKALLRWPMWLFPERQPDPITATSKELNPLRTTIAGPAHPHRHPHVSSTLPRVDLPQASERLILATTLHSRGLHEPVSPKLGLFSDLYLLVAISYVDQITHASFSYCFIISTRTNKQNKQADKSSNNNNNNINNNKTFYYDPPPPPHPLLKKTAKQK